MEYNGLWEERLGGNITSDLGNVCKTLGGALETKVPNVLGLPIPIASDIWEAVKEASACCRHRVGFWSIIVGGLGQYLPCR